MPANAVAIITGGSRGIGRATALRFARGGYALLLVARDSAALKTVEHEAVQAGSPRVETLACDLARADAAGRVADVARRAFGRVDVLVNNAGVAPLASVAEMTAGDFDALLATNVSAVFRLTQAIWPLLQVAGGGTIVNLSSVAAYDAFPGLGVYGASKAFINAFTRSTAEEGRPAGIRVFAIAPGATETRMLRSVAPDIPAEVVLDPDAIAAAIEAVCGPALQYSSGQAITVRR